MRRRHFLQASLAGLGTAVSFPMLEVSAADGDATTLDNGIKLPSPWPPKIADVPKDPQTPPYLVNPPAVIPIDVGRQLFVDDFLVEKTNLKRTHHLPKLYAKNPVLTGGMVFSDGVWYDAKENVFKMWYHTKGGTAYAISRDGLTWNKPDLDVKKGTNIVETSVRDSATIWMDLEEKDPKRRYKMFRSASYPEKKSWCLWVHFSEDGIHWTPKGEPTGSCGDRTTVFYNPFRKVWVYSLRHGWGQPRRRRYWETADDVVKGAQWGEGSNPAMWCGSDSADPQRPDYKVVPQLYNLDAVAYESILLGLFTIWRGQFPEREKPNEVCVGYSRDGWHWSRPDRRGFCPISESRGDWNYANVQSCGGCCLVVGEELYFYCSGRGQGHVTSLAILRRDGFTSMDAGTDGGELTTRPVRFSGKHLFVNTAATGGELRAELLGEDGKPIAPFTRENCTPITVDRTRTAIEWKEGKDLSALAGKVVRFRFHLKNAQLYAFWVSATPGGASNGYIAAGGPGLSGLTDAAGG